jgi:hypothetical protein
MELVLDFLLLMLAALTMASLPAIGGLVET